MKKTDDLRIRRIKEVITPSEVMREYPLSDETEKFILETRLVVHHILKGEDDRLLVIVGPCSIHDPVAALDYAKKLVKEREKWSQELLIIMRVYFEKPRTTMGWKGLINDPDLNDTFDINKGLKLARKLLLKINQLGLPAALEFLDIVTGQYLADLVSWGAIGARTTESQVHREMASGLSCPVGFKNGTDGNIQIAVDAVKTARHPHNFLSPTKDSHSAIFFTEGNEDSHLILRGGKQPNYDEDSVRKAGENLKAAGLDPFLIIDFSHANCRKQFKRQLDVAKEVSNQIRKGSEFIKGVMMESNLIEGRQELDPQKELVYGQSITDPCLGWEDTQKILALLAQSNCKLSK